MVKTSFALLAEGESALRSKKQKAIPDRISCQRRPAARFRLCEAQRKQLVSGDPPPILCIAESEAALAATLW